MTERKPTVRKKRTPQQTTFIQPVPQVRNGDILDVDEAAALLRISRRTIYNRVKARTIPHARVGRKLLFSRAKLSQWVADGADLAKPDPSNKPVSDHEQLTLDQLSGMQHRQGPRGQECPEIALGAENGLGPGPCIRNALLHLRS